jgi:hypothetical protein
MGYAIVLVSDDPALRATLNSDTPEQALTDLLTTIGTDSYPAGGLDPTTVGPWHRVGAFYSTGFQRFTVTDPRTVTLNHDGPDEGDAVWQNQITARDHMAATREMQRHPAQFQQKMARAGGDAHLAAFGPDRLAHSCWSVWWFYADALDRGAEFAPDTLDRLRAAISSNRTEVGLRYGVHGNALSKVGGAFIPNSPVHLIWSGNRVCRPDRLTDKEVEVFVDAGR